ncbi:MAG TPA: hypothetical protein VGM60_00690 [Pseudonocardia sp.]|uniref:hypothetical protein n=1 Tax=Pseudonocardia sp. TaxID=60912 RepID=UPI002F40EE57
MIWAAGALLGSSGAVKGASDDHSAGVPLANVSPSNPPPTGRLAQHGSPSSSASSPSPTPSVAPTSSSSPPPPPPPPPPQPCPDTVTQVTATVGAPSYPVGSRPVFTLHITNTGPLACTRDVSHQFRSLVVVAAGTTAPVWSSGDCYSLVTHEVPLLQPGQVVSYSVDWAGRTSAKGCPGSRTVVPPGQYALIGQLGSLTSGPTPFAMTPK